MPGLFRHTRKSQFLALDLRRYCETAERKIPNSAHPAGRRIPVSAHSVILQIPGPELSAPPQIPRFAPRRTTAIPGICAITPTHTTPKPLAAARFSEFPLARRRARWYNTYTQSAAAPQRGCRTLTSPWGNEDTQHLIDILGRYDVKTTFFVVGDWAEKYPESVQALHEAGHEVMSHSMHHDHYNSLTADQIVADVNASRDAIEKVTGVRPTLIRPPFGEYDDHVIAAIRSLGMEPIQWDVDSLDWKDYDADTICKRVTKDVRPGSIVLFHNAAKHTPEALPSILEYLIREGYTVVPISQLILPQPYTIDHTGRQFPAA